MTFRPTVLEADPGRRLRWLGRLVAPVLAGSLDRHTLPAFQLMNQALKRRAEQPQH